MEALAIWIPRSMDDYLRQRIGAGEDPQAARAHVASQQEQFFPAGRPGDGQFIMDVVDGDQVVGTLWLGRPVTGPPDAWFVYNIEIDAEFRSRGYGRATMRCAEAWVRERGGSRLGLNVFGPNVVARALYDSLGYQVQATAMFKDLG